MELVKKMLSGDRLSLARVISHIEDRGESLRAIIDHLYPLTGKAFILGITGPPGAGKSTVTDRLVTEIRNTGQRVAVVAIDPSSPFSGGAILGDRIRMQGHVMDPGVFIRSLGTRGKHGGLSHATKDVVLALDAAGFEWILVETAGVGQTELEILKLAHGVCVVLVPESGDGIQMMKAGLMEIADLFVVNKCDRPEADKVVREIINMISLGSSLSQQSATPATDGPWTPPVVKTQAISNIGISDLFAAVQDYRRHAQSSGTLQQKRSAFLRDEILEIIIDSFTKVFDEKTRSDAGRKILASVVNKTVTPYEAAEQLRKLIT